MLKLLCMCSEDDREAKLLEQITMIKDEINDLTAEEKKHNKTFQEQEEVRKKKSALLEILAIKERELDGSSVSEENEDSVKDGKSKDLRMHAKDNPRASTLKQREINIQKPKKSVMKPDVELGQSSNNKKPKKSIAVRQ